MPRVSRYAHGRRPWKRWLTLCRLRRSQKRGPAAIPCLRLSQITWPMSVTHHPTEDVSWFDAGSPKGWALLLPVGSCDHVLVIPRPFFDRPLWTDPLWWLGIVGGLFGGITYGLRADLGPADFAWQVFTGLLFFTWWVAGLLLSTVRFHFRRRKASRPTQQASEVPSNGAAQPSTPHDH